MFGRRGNGRKIEKHYWWLGLLLMVLSVATYLLAALGNLTDPNLAASWFAPVVSALLMLTGVQLVSAWSLARVLGELSRRESEMAADLRNTEAPVPVGISAPHTGELNVL